MVAVELNEENALLKNVVVSMVIVVLVMSIEIKDVNPNLANIKIKKKNKIK